MRRIGILVALIALVAACGSGPGGTTTTTSAAPTTSIGPSRYSSVQELATAVEHRLREDGTVRVSFKSRVFTDLESPGGGLPVYVWGEGRLLLDNAGRSMQLTVTQQRAGDVAVTMEVVALPAEVFVKLPPGQSPNTGKPWLRVDPNSTDPRTQVLTPTLARLPSLSDPLSTLARSFDMKITSYTVEPVDGIPAVRHSLTGFPRPRPDGSVDFDRWGIATLDIWIGSQDRLLRFQQDIQQKEGANTTASYAGWGQPSVAITPPPSNQVGTLGG